MYLCTKCGRRHTAEEFDQSRFCRACGAFLLSSSIVKQSIDASSRNRLATSTHIDSKTKSSYKNFFNEDRIEARTLRHSGSEIEDHLQVGEEIRSRPAIRYLDPRNTRKLVQMGQFDSFEKFQLNLRAQELGRVGVIDKLVSMDILRTSIDAHPYQMRVALSVLQEMNTNAILADEVGLGKTIEAGIIMKELLLRNMVNSILIIVPKSLLSQWKQEMAEKFGERFVLANDRREFGGFDVEDRIICSSGLLVRRFKEIAVRYWDLVIVDEAHTYRNTRSKGRLHLANVRRNYLLLLTATPLCNKLTDLYSLVDLIHSGVLETERTFISRYAADSKCRVVRSSMADELRTAIYGMMCRTRRSETDIPFTERHVESRRIEANEKESEFIENATEYLKDIGNNRYKTIQQLEEENPTRRITEQQSRAILILQAIALQQSLSSSPFATIESLYKRLDKYPSERTKITELIGLAKEIKSSKLELLRKVLKEIGDEQALIFCLRKATVSRIREVLDQEFGKAEVYMGDMGSSARERAIEEFRDGNTRYLVATDAAAEGLNLQKCNIMFNYDLHWNPMKIEQRIGRIHRFGQERDVTIFNLSIKDTIDDYVLHILYQKIELFNMTIGKMETVLTETKEGMQDIEKTIMEILLRSKNRIDVKKGLEKLSEDLNYAKEKQELAAQFTKGVLG
jgi:SNF2 family DNA or RNA helicase